MNVNEHLKKLRNTGINVAIGHTNATYEECMELVASGAIQDAKTIIALQYYALHFGGK